MVPSWTSKSCLAGCCVTESRFKESICINDIALEIQHLEIQQLMTFETWNFEKMLEITSAVPATFENTLTNVKTNVFTEKLSTK